MKGIVRVTPDNPLKVFGWSVLAAAGTVIGTTGANLACHYALIGLESLAFWRDRRKAERAEEADRRAYFEAETK